jgi:polygalacturonase
MLKDSPFWTLHLAWTENVYINNVTITSPCGPCISQAIGLNTDGIDIDCSVNVTVENTFIAVGKWGRSS